MFAKMFPKKNLTSQILRVITIKREPGAEKFIDNKVLEVGYRETSKPYDDPLIDPEREMKENHKDELLDCVEAGMRSGRLDPFEQSAYENAADKRAVERLQEDKEKDTHNWAANYYPPTIPYCENPELDPDMIMAEGESSKLFKYVAANIGYDRLEQSAYKNAKAADQMFVERLEQESEKGKGKAIGE
jgi:hypothetical protein